MDEDQTLTEVKIKIVQGWDENDVLGKELKEYFKICSELRILGDKLIRRGQIIPTRNIRSRILDIVHEGHPGHGMTK